MRKVETGSDANGVKCIWIKKTFLIKDVQKMCSSIEKKLEAEGYDVSVDIDITQEYISLDVSLLDDDGEFIGVVEYMCEEETESEFYQLNWINTDALNEEYTEDWDELSNTIVELIGNAF